MLLRKVALMLVATLGIILFSSMSFAATIEGSSSGIFENPVGPGGMVTTGVNTDIFTWGNGAPFGSPPSSLSFTGNNAIATDFDTLFSFGTLGYFNGTTAAGTEANSVDLKVNIVLTLPTGLSQDFIYALSLNNTPNTGDANASADYVTFPTTFPDTTFSIGSTSYTLAFMGFGDISGGGFSQLNEFHVLEGRSAGADLVGKITQHVSQVPEPSSVLLLGSGLIGLGYFGRKKMKK